MKNIAIFGAQSAIAEATARELAAEDTQYFLVGRDETKLSQIAADLKVRGANEAYTCVADLAASEGISASIAALDAAFDTVDIALLAHGRLPDQTACESSPEETAAAIQINGLSHIEIMTRLTPKFEEQGRGTIAVITSVAGDRGRKSNYVYGTAKSAVSTFLAGLRHRFAGTQVQVLDIRPGTIDTPMTAAFDKGPLWAPPEKVATDIARAVEKRRSVLYTPWYWWLIMLIIRNVPAFVLHRTNL